MRPLFIRRVVGHSMEPTLHPGQLVIATSLLSTKVDSVVIARKDDREVIKVLAKIDGDRGYLESDNPGHTAGWIELKDIIGTVLTAFGGKG